MSTEATPLTEQQGQSLAIHTMGADVRTIREYEAESLILKAEADSITITDQESYEHAVACGTRCATVLKKWAEFIQRPYEVVYGAYKTMLATKKLVEDPLEAGKKLCGQKVATWSYQQEQERQRKQRELEEQQRKQHEERNIAVATQAEQLGAPKEVVEQILETPNTAPKPAAAPTFQKSSGVSTRASWAGEVTDFHALVKAAAKDKKLLPLLQVNQPNLNAQARIHEANLSTVIPGTRGVNQAATSFRQAS